MWLCILLGMQFEDTFENAHWRKDKPIDVNSVTSLHLMQGLWRLIWKHAKFLFDFLLLNFLCFWLQILYDTTLGFRYIGMWRFLWRRSSVVQEQELGILVVGWWVFSALYLAVPGCGFTWLCPAVPGYALVRHDLPVHRMPHTSTDWPKGKVQNKKK